jgi:hypothetical protein
MARPVTLFTGQWADLPFATLCQKLRLTFGDMEREFGAEEALKFVRKVDFAPSALAFDEAMKSS